MREREVKCERGRERKTHTHMERDKARDKLTRDKIITIGISNT